MITTQQIKSTTSKPVELMNFESINVLKWNNSKWKKLCTYLLETDGNEICYNKGNILFENFYQGCKVYDTVYENKVYPSKFQNGNDKYLWWDFYPLYEDGDNLIDKNGNYTLDGEIQFGNVKIQLDILIKYIEEKIHNLF